MKKKDVVRLTEEERKVCKDTVARLKGSSQKARRARILLKVDADGPQWTDRRAADAFDCRVRTVEKLRQRCVLQSFELALNGRKRGPKVPRTLLDGQQEAELIALRLSPPPKGYARWSLRLLARQAIQLEITPTISHPTVANTLQKNGITGRSIQHWMLPAPRNGELAACRENVLATYARPHNPEQPVICMAEQPVQLVRETRQPLPATE